MTDSEPHFDCPVPAAETERIVLGHGGGGRLSAQLVQDIFLTAFDNPTLAGLEDQATLDLLGGRWAFTTDSFVVKPLFFPGGDIGSLAVHGTVNDLAMGGAVPRWLSVAFIIEEGFLLFDLRKIALSLRDAAKASGVTVATGDTKVVERGSADGVFINTTGIGRVPPDVEVSASAARPGDVIILSGGLGEHGISVMAQRAGMAFESPVVSDSAPLHGLVAAMVEVSPKAIHTLRDPTRGGLSSALNEIAAQSKVGMTIDETQLVIRDEVRVACEILGLDPLYVANEGKLVAIVERDAAEALLEVMRMHPQGREAAIIGAVREGQGVHLRTVLGTHRIVDMLVDAQLPRIC